MQKFPSRRAYWEKFEQVSIVRHSDVDSDGYTDVVDISQAKLHSKIKPHPSPSALPTRQPIAVKVDSMDQSSIETDLAYNRDHRRGHSLNISDAYG